MTSLLHRWTLGGATGNNSPTVIYRVEDYGAVGDAITDDAAALQLALDTAAADGGGTVVLDRSYKITTPLVMRSHVYLVGKNQNAGLRTTGNIDAIRFQTDADHPYIWDMQICGFNISMGTSTGYHIHFVSGEPWTVLVEDMLLVGGSNTAIQVDAGVNPFASSFNRIWISNKPATTNPLINWLGGGSGVTMDRLYLEPGNDSACTGMYLFTGNFEIGLLITGRGVPRALHNEYARTNVKMIHFEPANVFASKADSIVFQQFQNGFLRVGGVIISSGVSGNAMPNYVYKLGFQCPMCELGPVFSYSGSPTLKYVYYTHGDQNFQQFYWGPASHVDKSVGGTITCVTLGGLGSDLRVGSTAGGRTLDDKAEIYGTLGLITNSANVQLDTWAYSYSGPASPYTAFTLNVMGNSSAGVQRQLGQMQVLATSPTEHSEIGEIAFLTRKSGSLAERLRIAAGGIRTALGAFWDFGGYTAGAPVATGYMTVKINETTTIKLLASTE